MLLFLPTGQVLVTGEFQSRQAEVVTVIPWTPKGNDSKTLTDTQVHGRSSPLCELVCSGPPVSVDQRADRA